VSVSASSPNSSRITAIRVWTRSSRISRIFSVGSCNSRLTIVREIASIRAWSRSEAVSHLPSFSATTSAAIRAA
jgi:hypothetical protein